MTIVAVAADRTQSEWLGTTLAAAGLEVSTATSAEEAAAAAPDVVLYDTDVPGEWRAALARLRGESRVVVLSRLADTRMWIDVLDAGGFDLLAMPARPEELRAVVRSALGMRTRASRAS